jgi:hypothetical protein
MTIDENSLEVEYKHPENERPLNPDEIVEYIHTEHTPYSQMSLEDGKKHLADMIQRYAKWYHSLYRPGVGGLLISPDDWPKDYPPMNEEKLENI